MIKTIHGVETEEEQCIQMNNGRWILKTDGKSLMIAYRRKFLTRDQMLQIGYQEEELDG